MIVRLDKLPFAGFVSQKLLEWIYHLIVRYVEEWLLPLSYQCHKDSLKRLYNRLICHVWDGLGENVVGVIVVGDGIILVCVHGSGRQYPHVIYV